jgi:hypothetical protein
VCRCAYFSGRSDFRKFGKIKDKQEIREVKKSGVMTMEEAKEYFSEWFNKK